MGDAISPAIEVTATTGANDIGTDTAKANRLMHKHRKLPVIGLRTVTELSTLTGPKMMAVRGKTEPALGKTELARAPSPATVPVKPA